MSNRKFNPGDTVTNGLFDKKIIALYGDHYLTDCGKILFQDEDKWRKVKKGGKK